MENAHSQYATDAGHSHAAQVAVPVRNYTACSHIFHVHTRKCHATASHPNYTMLYYTLLYYTVVYLFNCGAACVVQLLVRLNAVDANPGRHRIWAQPQSLSCARLGLAFGLLGTSLGLRWFKGLGFQGPKTPMIEYNSLM